MVPFLFDVAAPIGVERLGRLLSGIPSGRTRQHYLLEHMVAAPPLPLVRLIACAQREAAAGAVPARVCVETLGALLTDGLLPEALREPLVEAADRLLEPGVRLLLEAPDEAAAERVVRPRKGSLAGDGETLGRRKQLARSARGDLLDKLLRDTHPDVIRNALLNPHVNEALAVRVAARRPVTGAILEVLAQSRFRTRLAVKRALVQNPYCPPRVACQLVGALLRGDLLSVAHDEGLSAEVRDAARLLLEAKPPKHPGGLH